MRYAFLYALADPTFPDHARVPPLEVAGKLMALAGFGDARRLSSAAADTIADILSRRTFKSEFRDSPLYNVGVEAEETKDAAALLSDRLFEMFAEVALSEIPKGLPLHIGGGCGLNCEWNARWRDLGHFSSVFVPPCTNDSGSAIGTAIDAIAAIGSGEPHIRWSVYAGLEFEDDMTPPAELWESAPLNEAAVAEALDRGRIVAWVQGKAEVGPRALGNRSLLAEPGDPQTKERLNEIKQREAYRPIAPCCRLEDVSKAFVDDFDDPYMLFFNRTRSDDLAAVTHVDGTARVQTVSRITNRPLHDLLTAVADRRGLGVLCNTSLNFKGFGFLNRMSDLERYCRERQIDDMVVGRRWFRRVQPAD